MPLVTNPARYRGLIYALAAALVGPASFVLVGAFGVSFFAYLALIAFWGLAALVTFCIAIAAAFGRHWRLTIVCAMLPATFAIFLLYADPLWRLSIDAGEYLHFLAMRGSYRAQIAAMPAGSGARLAVFTLREDGFAGMSNWDLVVYDESDEIALPAAARSAAWRMRVAGTALAIGEGTVWRLGDHFYLFWLSL